MNELGKEASREIMWNIPSSFKILMYALLVVSFLILIQGLYKKLLFVTGGKGLKNLKNEGNLIPSELNWKSFLQTIFFTGKVTRKSYVGFFHSLIYYGFIILWIATDLVAIHFDTPFKVFKGPVYIIVSFLADIAGVAILIGLFFAYHRRYIKKPDTLSSTNPKNEIYMYSLIGSLVIIGYIIEGIRIYGTGMPIGEQAWAPVGYLLASLFQTFQASEQTWASIYQGLWLVHMVSTMALLTVY